MLKESLLKLKTAYFARVRAFLPTYKRSRIWTEIDRLQRTLNLSLNQ